MIACLSAPSINALELELGLGYSLDPFYYNLDKEVFADQRDEHIVGKIGLSHTFNINTYIGIKVWADHLSLLAERDPILENHTDNGGKNLIGVSTIIKFF